MPDDPDVLMAGQLRWLATFFQPPDPLAKQNTFGRNTDPAAVKFQAYVALEATDGLELVSAAQKQAHATYSVTMRWTFKAMQLKPSWQMTLNWPSDGSQALTRTFELIEPPMDRSGRRRVLKFKVMERVT